MRRIWGVADFKRVPTNFAHDVADVEVRVGDDGFLAADATVSAPMYVFHTSVLTFLG